MLQNLRKNLQPKLQKLVQSMEIQKRALQKDLGAWSNYEVKIGGLLSQLMGALSQLPRGQKVAPQLNEALSLIQEMMQSGRHVLERTQKQIDAQRKVLPVPSKKKD